MRKSGLRRTTLGTVFAAAALVGLGCPMLHRPAPRNATVPHRILIVQEDGADAVDDDNAVVRVKDLGRCHAAYVKKATDLTRQWAEKRALQVWAHQFAKLTFIRLTSTEQFADFAVYIYVQIDEGTIEVDMKYMDSRLLKFFDFQGRYQPETLFRQLTQTARELCHQGGSR